MTPVPDPEQLVLCRDRDTGLRAIIAIDETRLGPALGGIRMRAYRSQDADVLAPCAVARVVDDGSVERLRARIFAGAANEVLARPDLADRLAARGVTYVPDFAANAGGVVRVRAHRDGWSAERLSAALQVIGSRVSDLLEEARATGATPQLVAEQAALERLQGQAIQPVAA